MKISLHFIEQLQFQSLFVLSKATCKLHTFYLSILLINLFIFVWGGKMKLSLSKILQLFYNSQIFFKCTTN